MHKRLWLLVPVLFAIQAVFCTVFAWNGSNIPLITLAVTAVVLACLCALYGWAWGDALERWARSTDRWAAAQDWGITVDGILNDTLEELAAYDDEAVAIHGGRSATASLEYLKALEDELP